MIEATVKKNNYDGCFLLTYAKKMYNKFVSR